ncbi:IS66-like element accessory protein TnpA, partial [Sphingobium sp. MK2]|uniref:IS66-like element accessory protein TnpA n=1 Tax=Sphingobium sp. MK2 TaxID=3116540 RepID=UPI0032E3683B
GRQPQKPRMSGRGDGGALVQVERRRNWSDEEKLAILKETTVPGVVISAVARRHGIGTGQLYTWRKQLLRGAMAGFVPVELAASSPSAKAREAGRIEVRGQRGLTVSVDGEVDRAALKQVLDVLRELDH